MTTQEAIARLRETINPDSRRVLYGVPQFRARRSKRHQTRFYVLYAPTGAPAYPHNISALIAAALDLPESGSGVLSGDDPIITVSRLAKTVYGSCDALRYVQL